MSSFRADDSEFYDFEYFLSLEYRYFSRAHRSRVRNLLEFMGDVKGKKILDMGGGGGFIAYMLSDRGAHVCLADFSEAAVAFAQSRFPQLKTVQISGYKLENLGAQYDLVICLDVIEHLERPKDILEAIRKVLLPDGRFYIATDNETSLFNSIPLLCLLAKLGSHLSSEGRDYNMIKRVEITVAMFWGKTITLVMSIVMDLKNCGKRLKASVGKYCGFARITFMRMV